MMRTSEHTLRRHRYSFAPILRVSDCAAMWIAWRLVVPKTYSFLQQFAELVGGQVTVSEDSMEQTGADGLARVHRHNRAPAILVTQKVMAAFNAKNAKPFRGRQ